MVYDYRKSEGTEMTDDDPKDHPRRPPRAEAAHHEAGHAVMALHLDMMVAKVDLDHMVTTLRGEELRHLIDTYNGEDNGAEPVDEKRLWENHILFCLAGEQAERVRAERVPGSGLNEEWWGKDRQDMEDYALRAIAEDEEREAYLRWLTLRARNILRQLWPIVEAVAQALLEKPVLVYDEISGIWNRVTAPPSLSPDLLASLANFPPTRR